MTYPPRLKRLGLADRLRLVAFDLGLAGVPPDVLAILYRLIARLDPDGRS